MISGEGFDVRDLFVPAHVDYVTEPVDAVIDPIGFVIRVLSNPINASMLLGGAVLAVGALVVYFRKQPAVPEIDVLRGMLDAYEPLVPLVVRLSVGLPLIGAGTQGHLFALTYTFDPAANPFLRVTLITIGFCLVFGVATRVFAVIGLGTYLGWILVYPGIVLAMEYVACFVAVFLLGSGTLSIDDILQRVEVVDGPTASAVTPAVELQRELGSMVSPYQYLTPLVLRVGTGITFIFLGTTQKIGDPARAIRVVEKYDLTAVLPVDPGLLVLGVALTEVTLGLLLLAGLLTRPAAVLAFSVFTSSLFGLHDDPVLAHITFFGLATSVFTLGAGPFSLDRALAVADIEHWNRRSVAGLLSEVATGSALGRSNPPSVRSRTLNRTHPPAADGFDEGANATRTAAVFEEGSGSRRTADRFEKRGDWQAADSVPASGATAGESAPPQHRRAGDPEPGGGSGDVARAADGRESAVDTGAEADDEPPEDPESAVLSQIVAVHRTVADRHRESGDTAYENRDTEAAREQYREALSHLTVASELIRTFDLDTDQSIDDDIEETETAIERTQWQWGQATSGDGQHC